MGQDIRDMFRREEDFSSESLNKGHRERFSRKLEREMPVGKRSYRNEYLKMAAVLVVALGIGFFLLAPQPVGDVDPVVETSTEIQETEKTSGSKFQLSDVSPEYKKVENYYLASLNMELARLELTEENKEVIDAYMGQLAELDKEYQRLNQEVERTGPNSQAVEAMIGNLQLRLELMFKLKDTLKEIRESKQKEYENLQA